MEITASEQALYDLLNQHNIPYEVHTHPPVFTTEEASQYTGHLPGAHTKNLFLRDRKKKNLFLVSLLEAKRVDLKALSKDYGSGGLSFGNDELLFDTLQLKPGSVSPFGLMQDPDSKVVFLFDEDFLSQECVNFHPLRNDKTLSMKTPDFVSFMETIVHPGKAITIPTS